MYNFFFFKENDQLSQPLFLGWYRVEPFEAALTAIWTFKLLTTMEVHYMEKNPGMFSPKTLISLRLKKDMNILDDMGGGGG